ncbi:MAG: hypothetical protein LW721_17990 [Flammeovirgaceae bacterium]|jgi:hypothetical protein|nr:hypothetical protein [Flammeovirgaceae bacterium]
MDTEVEKNRLIDINPRVSCLVVVLVYLVIIVIKHQVLISDEVLRAEFTGDDFEGYKEALLTFRLVKYLFLTGFFFGAILFTFFLIYGIGFLIKLPLNGRQLFNIALLSSFGDILNEGFIVCWFWLSDSFQIADVFGFYPMSVFSLVNNSDSFGFPSSFVLQSLNFFLLVKFFLVGLAYYYSTEKTAKESYVAAFLTYLLPVLIIYSFVLVVF